MPETTGVAHCSFQQINRPAGDSALLHCHYKGCSGVGTANLDGIFSPLHTSINRLLQEGVYSHNIVAL